MFSLNRLILIDSYKPGSVQEVRLDGHTNLNGVNGAGKTTLLRLIPLFFGERPGRLVPKSRVTESFAKHYLPNESSYIIFEYRRLTQVCMAVIYASPNEEGLCYRFVDKGFEPEDFLERHSDGSLYPVSCRNLNRHFTHRRINCSVQLTSGSDYRTIIQNLPHKKGQEFRSLIARYSFCDGSSGRRLKNIEKIVSGMLLRSTSFADLREMLVNCIDENRESIDLNLQLETLEDWHKEYRAFHQVEAERDKVTELRRLQNDLAQTERDLGELRQRLQLLFEKQDFEKQGYEKTRFDCTERLHHLRKNWDDLETELKSQLATAKADREQAERQLQLLEKEHDAWQKQDMPGKQLLFARLDTIAESLQREKDNLAQLMLNVQDIELEFKRLRAEQEKGFGERKHALELQIGTIHQTLNEQKIVATEAMQQQKDQIRESLQAELEEAAQVMANLQGQLGELRGRMQNIQPDQTLLDSRDSKLEQQEAVREQKNTADGELSALNEQMHRLRRQIEDVLAEKETRKQEGQQIEQAISRLQQQLGADSGSLLGFLREQHPDWTRHIAKVINPELLLREDLEPTLANADNGFYGIDLNLDVLSADLAADEQKIRDLLQDYQHQIKQLQNSDQQSDRQLDDYRQQSKKLTQLQQESTLKSGQLQNKLGQLAGELESLKQQIVRSKQERQGELAKQTQEMESRIRQQRELSITLKQKREIEVSRLDTALKERIQGLERLAEEGIRSVQRDIELLAEEKAKALAQLEKQRLQSLKERKIDTETLTALETRIKQLKAEHDAAEKAGQIIKQHQRWVEQEWLRYPQLQKQRTDAAARQEALQTQLEAERQRLDAARKALESGIEQHTRAINKLAGEMQAINSLLENLQNLPCRSAGSVDFDTSHTLALLQTTFRNLSEQHKSLCREFSQLISHYKRVLARSPGTQPARYCASMADQLGFDAEDGEWSKVITDWYESRHEESRHWLIMQAQMFGSLIRDYQQALDRFDRGIDSLSRSLAAHIDSNIRFEKIESIQGRLLSKVKKLGYWEQLAEFTRNYEDWRRVGESRMPDHDFADIVKQVAEQLSGKGRTETKLVELLELEIIVHENGRSKRATHAEELKQISSHGLSYLILCVFFIALVNMIRKDQKMAVIWPMDELKELHQMNIELLVDILNKNNITLLSAFPDPDPEVLGLFKNRYQIIGNRELLEMAIDEDYLQALEPLAPEVEHV
jgi:DNA repair exonuclease SbcCD ATPase subunit